MINPDLVVVAGPLSPFRDGFGSWLEAVGYSRTMRAEHLRLMAALSRWLEERGKAGEWLSRPAVAEFLAGRQGARVPTGRSMTGIRPLMEYLRGAGAAPPDEPEPPSGPAEEAIAEYASYLRTERGLAAATVRRETHLIRPFLTGRIRDTLADLETLTAADVQAFVLDCARTAPPSTVQRTGTALRSLLRFLHLQGITAAPLAGAVPATANWTLSGLPRHLTREETARILDSCNTATVTNGLVLRSDAVLWRFVAHDGSEGLSPDGWLPDRISVGVLTGVFTPELVDAAVEAAGARERRWLLPARLVVYFTLALWLFRGRNCGYGRVMTKLADGLYHQRRAADLLEGQLDPDGWVDAGQGRRCPGRWPAASSPPGRASCGARPRLSRSSP